MLSNLDLSNKEYLKITKLCKFNFSLCWTHNNTQIQFNVTLI